MRRCLLVLGPGVHCQIFHDHIENFKSTHCGARRCFNNSIVKIHEVSCSYDSERTNEQTPYEYNAVQMHLNFKS